MKSITRIDSLELIMRMFPLGESNVNLDWPMTRDLYEFGGDAKQHPQLVSRSPEGQTLIWFDAGNTWANSKIVKASVKNAHIAAYTRLAYVLSQYFERFLYVIVGQGLPLHSWSENYHPSVREHHKNIFQAIRCYIPNQVFVDEHWRDMNNPNKEDSFTASFDMGFQVGYTLVHDNVQENARRLSFFVQGVDMFFTKLVALVNSLYEPLYALGFERPKRSTIADVPAQITSSAPNVF